MPKRKANCHCQMCNGNWFSYKLAMTRELPDACAKCKSYHWNRPRRRDARGFRIK